MNRFREVRPLWIKLKLRLPPYKLKLQAIRVAAWPRVLYGAGVTHLPWNSFKPLRTGAMKGLGEKKPGQSYHSSRARGKTRV